MTESTLDKLTFTEAEFCRIVGISRTTAWNLRCRGKLPFCRVGSKILYTPKHIEQFLDNHERSVTVSARIRNKGIGKF